MKKTSTRLATIAIIIVLGAFAIALAQHDARKRDREQPQLAEVTSQQAEPIPLEDAEVGRGSQRLVSTNRVVRGNNNDLQDSGTTDLPAHANLLQSAARNMLDDSQVVQASGVPDGPSSSGSAIQQAVPAAPPSLPAWLDSGSLPSGEFPAAGGGAATPPPSMAAAPALPTFPMNTANKPDGQSLDSAGSNSFSTVHNASNASALPSLAAPMPAPPTSISNAAADMSDTQRPPMQPTNMLPIQNLTSSPGGQPPGDYPSSAPAGSLPQNKNPAGSPSQNAYPSTTPYSSPYTAPSGRSPPGEGSDAINRSFTQSSESSVNAGSSSQADNRPPSASTAATAAGGGNARTPASLTGLVSNLPGNRYLDGSQNPILLIQKRAPEEIQVGKKAMFVITVRNAGNATAHNVSVVDSVPRGVRFVESAPAAQPNAQGILAWELGEMSAGDERTITLQIVPEVQGEVGSVASVHFAAQASVRTVATLPKLEVQMETQSDVLIGSRQQIAVTIRNTGTGVARGVRLEADIPELLQHESGEAQLEAVLGDMRPNEIRRITLDVTAIQPGQSAFAIRANSEDGIGAEDQAAIEVLAPQLTATIEGPRLRYLERQATYHIHVRNVGTTAASNLDFVVHLPAGLKYNSSNNRGTYDRAQHTVAWGLYELPAGETAPIELTVLPVELGPQAITFAASGDLGISAEAKWQVEVDGLAELAFTIGQDNGTIEVGASSTYSVQVTNVGNKPDMDVSLAVQLPNGAQLLDVDAQVSYRAEGNQIIFEPVAEMRNKDTYTYRFQVQYPQAGMQIVRTQLTSANWPVAVTKEEGTLVYNDQN